LDMVLKIRGIYSTALTKFLLDRRFRVALPSWPMAARFGGLQGFDVLQGPDVQIRDLENKQGVILEGEEASVEALLSQVRERFFDAVIRRREKDAAEIEFPLGSKSLLDEIRGTVVPTLLNHHRLKIICPDRVDRIEAEVLAVNPEMSESLGCSAEKEWIWGQYERGKEIAIEHVKLNGRVLHLSKGEVLEEDFSRRRLILKRFQFEGRGRYDGLGIPREEGDYAVSEIRGGEWHYCHTYFRARGKRVGTYYNINTPLELYPDRIRYVDLEIDVVQFPSGKVDIVDEGELEKRFQQGYIGAQMQKKATAEALRLKNLLTGASG
jgi:hypothetical protein